MPLQFWFIKTLPRLFKQNKRLQNGCQSCAHQKPLDPKNGEDTKETLQVLFPCTVKHVVFIVDISNNLF